MICGFVCRDWLTLYRLLSIYLSTLHYTQHAFKNVSLSISYPNSKGYLSQLASTSVLAWPRLLLSAAIMSQESASDAADFSTGLGKDLDDEPAMYEKYAITTPFGEDAAGCNCESEARYHKEPMSCQYCCPVSAFGKRKSEAIKQNKRRWTWFSAARKLDEELNTRLGTLGYLPLEIRLNIFRLVLENYREEALTYQIHDSSFGYPYFDYEKCKKPVGEEGYRYPSSLEWQAIKDYFKERHIELYHHHDPENPSLYNIFSLHSHNADHIEPAFAMDLRLSTVDIQLEFDHVFLSTTTFRFSCQKALGRFVKQLSPIQLSQVRSIIIEISACWNCYREGIEYSYKSWASVCSQLPSTLRSIRFAPGLNGSLPFDDIQYPTTEGYSIKKKKRAERTLEFLSCRVRHMAPEAEVCMTKRRNRVGRLWDILDSVVGETDTWSKEYVEWKKGLDSSE